MASRFPQIPQADIDDFHQHLLKSTRVLALCGAGLSASSGLPTFRGAGGLWRTHDATDLATPQAFEANPGLVWQFYSYRRHMALKAHPNPAHYALAELARRMPDFQTLTQNVDGLSQRAKHPRRQLHLLHGTLFDVKCSEFYCNYRQLDNFTDPIVPALELPSDESDPTTTDARVAARAEAANGIQSQPRELDISDERIPLPELTTDHLPHCPQCTTGLLRPGVVWFGEMLPKETLRFVEDWIDAGPVDLIMVIGTSSRVYPAAGYTDHARKMGARVAIINTDRNDEPAAGLNEGDWFFEGDASVVVPELLRPVIGDGLVNSWVG